MRTLLAMAVLLPHLGAQTGSISGMVRDAASGSPIRGVTVLVSKPGSRIPGKSTTTGDDGLYTLKDIAAGRASVSVTNLTQSSGEPLPKTVGLQPGQNLTGVDFLVDSLATISGKVLDYDRKPLAGVAVTLRQREYHGGVLYYTASDVAMTNADGVYELTHAKPGPSYLVSAFNPKSEKVSFAPAYYPGATNTDDAAPVVLLSGEHRQGMDLHMTPSATYCIEGAAEFNGDPVAVRFTITEEDLHDTALWNRGAGATGRDGTFRTCGLFPGRYRVTVDDTNSDRRERLGALAQVTLKDADIRHVRLAAQRLNGLAVQSAWDKEPDPPLTGTISVVLESLQRVSSRGWVSKIPQRTGAIDLVLMEQRVRTGSLPKGQYVKELTAGSVDLLRHPVLMPSTLFAAPDIRIVVARDGGVIGGKVADKDGKGIASVRVYIMPKDAVTPAELSVALVTVSSDANGLFVSGTLAPGSYQVVASEQGLFLDPEGMARLIRARAGATEVVLHPHGAEQVTLTQVKLE